MNSISLYFLFIYKLIKYKGLIFEIFCTEEKTDKEIFVKILDLMDIVSFKPYTAKKRRPGDSKGSYPLIEDELYTIPREYYYKLGYIKISSDTPTELTYRRYFNTPLEESNSFKVPFTEEEKATLKDKLIKYSDIYNKIISSSTEAFRFKQPFRTEHLIRGKTQTEKNQNSLFENFRDKAKFTFTVEKGMMKPNETLLVRNSLQDKQSKNESIEATRQRLSKGQFKYLMRIYNTEMFEKHLNRLEKSIALFSDVKSEEIEQIKKSKVFKSFLFLIIFSTIK